MDNLVDNVDNRRFAQNLPAGGPVLAVFAKQPVPGRVKTRLSPPLAPAEACALYRVALQETVKLCAETRVATVLGCAGRQDWFARSFPALPRLAQGRGDLGRRLARVTAALFAAGCGPVAVIGSDSPDLPPALIHEAFTALATADAAAVSTADGGFALLALQRPAPELFRDIPWSTPRTLAALRVRAEQIGLDLATVGGWDDLDDLPSLHRLLARSPTCATAHYVRVHLGRRLCPAGG